MKRIASRLRARFWRLHQARSAGRQRADLSQIVGQYPVGTPIFLFPPGLDWNTQLFQRPQHLAQALAHLGALVFYMQPDENECPAGFHLQAERLYLSHVPRSAFRDLPAPWVYSLTWNARFAWEITSQNPTARLVYDCVDHLDAFQGRRRVLERQHLRLLEQAERVFATSVRLYDEVTALRPDTWLCPNGVDYAHFAAARGEADFTPPHDLAPVLRADRPVIGYYGALAAWFDYDLLAAVAALRPDLSFVLIGPDHDRSLPPTLRMVENISWLGVKPYRELPAYLRFFDVGIIPFKLNELTHATSPLKLFEYMAAGKPVVVTPMQESMRYPVVLPAAGPREFSEQIDTALRLRHDPAYLGLLDRTARENTWEQRASLFLEPYQGL